MKIDITGKIGQLNGNDKPEWPMYSFDRPAHYFWNGVANGLKKSGLNDEEIKDWLQSKAARWLLDSMGEKIVKLGKKYGKKCGKEEGVKFAKV